MKQKLNDPKNRRPLTVGLLRQLLANADPAQRIAVSIGKNANTLHSGDIIPLDIRNWSFSRGGEESFHFQVFDLTDEVY
jgi:hypothetical protein